MKPLFNFLLFLPLALFCDGFLFSQTNYVGVWSSGSGNNLIVKFDKWSEFIADGNQKAQRGLRLADFEYFKTGNTNNYVGVWSSGSGTNLIVKFDNWSEFIADGNQKAQQGLRLTDFEYFKTGNTNNYVGVWSSGSGANLIVKFDNWSKFIADGNQKAQQGLRLTNFEYFKTGSTNNYVGVWSSGSGTNLIVKFGKWSDFIADGNQKAQQGLRLADFEYFKTGNTDNYVGVWRNGSGSNLIVKFDRWSEFIEDGKKKVNKGLRLIDFDVIPPADVSSHVFPKRPIPTNPPPTSLSCDDLPETPDYIGFNGNGLDIIVDFSYLISGNPKITIPSGNLPLLPICEDGRIIYPDNFCGIRVSFVERFFWIDRSGKILGDILHDFHPVYNSIPEGQSLFKLGMPDGIEFTGPIGACGKDYEPWHFPTMTKTDFQSFDNDQVMLVIEINPTSNIEFLNYNVSPEKLDPFEIFKDETLKDLADWAKSFPELFDIRAYIQENCEINPLKCPIGKSERWW